MNEKAIAYVYGSAEYPRLQGRVTFHQIQDGVLITAEVHGLPVEQDCSGGIFGFHIHEGNVCTGNTDDPFANTGGHYNPTNCPHPRWGLATTFFKQWICLYVCFNKQIYCK